MKQYDLVIIGSGSAARTVALDVRAAGWQVAVIDFRPFGGTCPLRGCVPKKALISGAAAFDYACRMRGRGVTGELQIEWQQLMAFKHTFIERVSDSRESTYHDKGIDTYHGVACFVGKNTIKVKEQQIEAKYILIASGEEPVKLNIPGEQYMLDSEDFLQLKDLPRRVLLVGGGYVAAEYSHIAARAGAQVTIVQQSERLLKMFDAELVGWLMASFTMLGIEIWTSTRIENIEKIDSGYRVTATNAGEKLLIEADIIVHAAGQAPAFDRLNLAAAGIETLNGRLKLNRYLQSISNPSVYAAGDAAGTGPLLTPVAVHDAQVVVANLLNGNHQQPNYLGVPSVVFTIPPLAAVGLTEAQAYQQGIKFRMQSQSVPNWFTASWQAEPIYGYKMLIDAQTDHILGAHLVGPQVDEVINIFALAVRHGLTAADLKATLFAFPTGASDIGMML